jgi:DNA polymerase III epsilon subunit-like protein
MLNIMIDLETMSTEVNAAILSIGAVEMNFETKELGREFYVNVVLSSCLKLGMHRSQSTLEWWSKDENKAARDMLTKDAVSIESAVSSFNAWCAELAEPDNLAPWSNGAGFDIPILANAIRICGKQVPWKFYNESCFRTLKRLFYSVRVPRANTMKHHALEDAKNQARHLLAIMSLLMVRDSAGAILPIELQEKQVERTGSR